MISPCKKSIKSLQREKKGKKKFYPGFTEKPGMEGKSAQTFECGAEAHRRNTRIWVESCANKIKAFFVLMRFVPAGTPASVVPSPTARHNLPHNHKTGNSFRRPPSRFSFSRSLRRSHAGVLPESAAFLRGSRPPAAALPPSQSPAGRWLLQTALRSVPVL